MLHQFFSGDHMLRIWTWLLIGSGIAAGVWTGFFAERKIQPKGFKWKQFRYEACFAVVTLAFSGFLVGGTTRFLKSKGVIALNHEPAAWWVILLEYALYFFLFDAYFYWLHRLMHKEPIYSWVHKIHHRSTAPNLLTTISESPLEALINGGFVPLFLSVFTVHDAAVALITPTNIFMGLYVHSGYEFFPRWWNRSWATKWFITATFHDQHHKFFTGNFGGYTTIWDRLCGTMRPKFEADFDKLKGRRDGRSSAARPRPTEQAA